MSNSGKKGKKNKGTVISLQSFLSNGDVPVGTTQVAKNIRNIDNEDSDDGGNVLTVVCQLPTAPRANRIFDDSSIPHKAPFVVYLTNLPFDVKEDDIYDYFNSYQVKSVRLPREDGETGRVRGFGYVEFATRDELIQSLGIPDPTIKGRRIRIDLSNENEQNLRQRGNRKGFEMLSGNVNGRDSTNWRSDNTQKKESFSFGNLNRDQKAASDENRSSGSWRIRDSFNLNEPSKFEQVSEREVDVDDNKSLERPKLILKPRTLPLPDLKVETNKEQKNGDINDLKGKGISSEKVFGSAKPVDTVAKDLEIEKRLAEVRLHKAVKQNDSDIHELKVGKDDQGVNAERSWRRHQTHVEISKRSEDKMFHSASLLARMTPPLCGLLKPVDTVAKDLEIEKRLAEVRLHKAVKQNDSDIHELKVGKDDQGVNAERSWRRHQTHVEISKRSEDKMFHSDIRRDNRHKYHDKTERYDKAILKDVKRKDLTKTRREIKIDKNASKNVSNLQNEQDSCSSNKYYGLDEVSD